MRVERFANPTLTMRLPSPLLVFCGVVAGLLLADLHYDLPILLGGPSETAIGAAFSHYAHLEQLWSHGSAVVFIVPSLVGVAFVSLAIQFIRYTLIEDMISFFPLGAVVYNFLDGVIEPRRQLTALDDQPQLQLPLLTQIAKSHLYIAASLVALFILQIGAQRSVLVKQEAVQEARLLRYRIFVGMNCLVLSTFSLTRFHSSYSQLYRIHGRRPLLLFVFHLQLGHGPDCQAAISSWQIFLSQNIWP